MPEAKHSLLSITVEAGTMVGRIWHDNPESGLSQSNGKIAIDQA
jgi:hypothetical protein